MVQLVKQLLLQFRVTSSHFKKENIKNIIFSSYSFVYKKQNKLFFALFAKKQRINSSKKKFK